MMVYWAIVGAVWIVSIIFLFFAGYLFADLLNEGFSLSLFLAMSGLLLLGLVLNFIVVNWPIGGNVRTLDEKTLKLLKYLAKVAPLAPRTVRVELEKLVRKYSS